MRSPLMALLMSFFSRLRYPWLFGVAAALFLFDMLIPDMLPLADEILLAVVTVLLASRKRAQEPAEADPPVIDITPEP